MRIVIASRQPVTRSAIRRFLQIRLGLNQINEAATPADLLAQVESEKVDLVVLDEDIRAQSTAQVVKDLKKLADPPIVFVLEGGSDNRPVFLDAGPDAFLYKGDPPRNLLIAVETVRQTKTMNGGYHDNFQTPTDR